MLGTCTGVGMREERCCKQQGQFVPCMSGGRGADPEVAPGHLQASMAEGSQLQFPVAQVTLTQVTSKPPPQLSF